jgi:hypothetical protein
VVGCGVTETVVLGEREADVPAGHSADFGLNNSNRPPQDAILIPIDAPARPADVGEGDVTVEFWMRHNGNSHQTTQRCDNGPAGWRTGAVIYDRSVLQAAEAADDPELLVPSWGIALFADALGVGVESAQGSAGLCGTFSVMDNLWHHVAVTREQSSGLLRLFVDGHLEREVSGPTGDLSYPDGRPPAQPLDDFLVLGTLKSSDEASTAYDGLLDELRISDVVRYLADFEPPNDPFEADAATRALYTFDEEAGARVVDHAAGASSPGERRGTARGPQTSFHAGP